MKHVKKSVLLWYSAQEMYALVTAVGDYPKFLPWCERVDLLEARDDGVTARLHLNYHGVRHAFTTRNTQVPHDAVQVQLVDGPFSLLEGSWRFTPIGTPGPVGESPRASRVELDLRYAFSGVALEAVVSPVFDRIANTLVDAFVARAEHVHGPR